MHDGAGTGGKQAHGSIKFELSFAIHSFGTVRVVERLCCNNLISCKTRFKKIFVALSTNRGF